VGGWSEDLLWSDYQAEISDRQYSRSGDITDRMTVQKANKKKKKDAKMPTMQDGGATKSATSTGAVPQQNVTEGIA
jgi:hypothetical protein